MLAGVLIPLYDILYQPHTGGKNNTNSHIQGVCGQHSITLRTSYYLSSQVLLT